MSRDQAIGTLIFLVCIVVAVGYVVSVAFPNVVKYALPWLPWNERELQFGAVAAVVLLAFLAMMFIGAWIGWVMATTPPPRPIEDLEKGVSNIGQESSESQKDRQEET